MGMNCKCVVQMTPVDRAERVEGRQEVVGDGNTILPISLAADFGM